MSVESALISYTSPSAGNQKTFLGHSRYVLSIVRHWKRQAAVKKVVCAWCAPEAEPSAGVTHGMCPTCFVQLTAGGAE
jgi:hypothetical protein